LLEPNSVRELIAGFDPRSLKITIEKGRDALYSRLKGRFHIKCNCGYNCYSPFPSTCPKCGRSNTAEIQQFNFILNDAIDVLTAPPSTPQSPTAAPQVQSNQIFCKNCGCLASPNHKFCKECGSPLGSKEIPLWERLYDEGTILMQQRKFQEALDKFFESYAINNNDPELLSNIGACYINMGKEKEGLQWLDKSLEINPHDAVTLCNKGTVLAMDIQYDEAIKTFETLLNYNPNFSRAKFLLMQTKRQRYSFERLKLNERNIPQEAVGLLKDAMRDLQKRKTSSGKTKLKKALEIYPEFGIAEMNLGTITLMEGDLQGALTHFDRAIEIDPTLADVWSHKGMVYDKMEQYNKAIECYDEAIKIDPFFSASWNNKGLALERLEKNEEALNAYTKSIELNPDYDGAYHNRAVIYKKMGKLERAIRDYQKVLELNPYNEEAKDNIERLKHYSSPSQEGIFRTVVDARDYCPRCQKKNYTNSPNCPYCGTPMHSENTEEALEQVIEMEAMGQFGAALTKLVRINNIDPTNSSAWYYRGKAHCALAEFRNALACFAKAQELGSSAMQLMMYGLMAKNNVTNFKRPNLNPSHLQNVEVRNPGFFPNEESWMANGAAYQMLMQYEEAYISYQKALEIKPDYRPAKKNLDMIVAISNK